MEQRLESLEFSLERERKGRGGKKRKRDREHLSDSSSIDSLAFVDLNHGFCTYQKLGVFGESESPWSPRGTFQQAGEIVLVILEPLRQTRRQGNEGEEHHRGQPRPSSHPVAVLQVPSSDSFVLSSGPTRTDELVGRSPSPRFETYIG